MQALSLRKGLVASGVALGMLFGGATVFATPTPTKAEETTKQETTLIANNGKDYYYYYYCKKVKEWKGKYYYYYWKCWKPYYPDKNGDHDKKG